MGNWRACNWLQLVDSLETPRRGSWCKRELEGVHGPEACGQTLQGVSKREWLEASCAPRSCPEWPAGPSDDLPLIF